MKKIFFMCLGLLFLFSSASAAVGGFSVNQAIDDVNSISASFTTKISDDILTLQRVDETTKNRLLVDFQNYVDSLATFSTDIADAQNQEQFFNSVLDEYMALSKVLGMYKSNDSLFNLIESNYTLLNTIDAYIQDFNLPSEVIALTQESRSALDQLEIDIADGVTDIDTGIPYASLLSVSDESDFTDYQRIVIVSDSHLSSYRYFKTKYLTESSDTINNINSVLASAAEFSPHRSVISADKSSIEIDKFGIVSVKVLSYSNSPFEGTELTLRSPDANVVITPTMQKLNENGIANFKVERKTLGKISLEALVESEVILIANDIIDVYEISEENSTIVANPSTIDIGEVSRVTVTVKDNSGKTLRGVRVGLTASRGVLLDFESVITNRNGLAIFELTGDEYFTIDLSASLNQKTLSVAGIIEVITPEEQDCIDDSHGTWNGSSCNCDVGYVWTGSECITQEEQDCIDDSNGAWNGSSCDCNTGYVWTGSECITQEEQACIDGGGTWDVDKKICTCLTGFVWNADQKTCISEEEQACIDDVKGSWVSDKCDCGEGYTWNSSTFICEVDVSPEEQGCIDSGGAWIGGVCKCSIDFIWNPETMMCEKK